MANQPHRDDDQAKKRADDTPVFKRGPKTPQPKPLGPKTPVPSMTPKAKSPSPKTPSMSLDEPVEEAEEVLEAEEAAIEEAEPAEEIEAELITGDEVETAEPIDEADEVFEAEDVVEVTGSSAVLAEAPAVSVTPPKSGASAPASDVDLMSLFEDAPTKPASGARSASEPTPDPEADMMDKLGKASAVPRKKLEAAAAAEIAEAAPASGVKADEAVFEEAIAEPFDDAEEVAEAAPVSDVVEAEEVAEAAPVSDVVEAEEVAEAAPVSDVVAEEVVESAPESAVEAAEEAFEEATEAEPFAGAPLAESEAAHAPPESAAAASSEAAAIGPESAVVASAESRAEIAEAPPASAARGEDVLYDDAVAAIAPPSEMHSGEVVEEVVEMVDEASSATRKAEAVLDDEVAEAEEVVSGVEFDEATLEPVSAAKSKTAVPEKTVAFEPPSSKIKKPDEEILVTEEEIDEAAPASAVDLGEMPARKGSSVTGIDKVAEALESGVDIDAEAEAPASMKKTAGSVEFDELLDDLGDSNQEIPTSKKKKKTVGKLADEATELDTEAVAAEEAEEAVEAAAADDEAPVGKKGKKKEKAAVKATGDDIDLNDLFDDEAKPAEAEEAAEAEASEAFEDEVEAAEAEASEEDDKPVKKGKMGEATAEEDEEEETGAKKTKGKKEKATVAPAPAASGTFLRVFIGMVLATIIIVPVLGAAVFLAPNQIADLAKMAGATQQPKPSGPSKEKEKEHVATVLDKAHKAIDEGKFDEAVTELAGSTEEAEVGLRGEAKWLAHFRKNGPVDHADLKAAREDLKNGKRDLLLKQIDALLAAGSREADLNDQVSKANKAVADVAKQLTAAKADLTKANDASVDATKQVTAAKAELAKALTANADAAKQLTAATEEKVKAEKQIDSIADVLVKGKLIQKKADLDVVAMEKLIKSLNDDRTALETVNNQLKDAEAARAAAVKERAAVLKTIDDTFKELVAAKIVIDPKDDKSKNKVLSELIFFRSREPFVETPQQKMNTYIALLQDRSLNNPKQLADINRETEWVLAPDAKSDADARGKARYVQGLALRNQEKFAEARKAFEESIAIAKGSAKAGVWATHARKSLAEITEPRAYYLPRIERLRNEGNFTDAVDEATHALKAMPGEAIFNVHRGLVGLETVKGKGPKIADEVQKAIRADAEAASKDAKLAGESAYIVGILEEELQNWPEAEKQFRMAIKLSEGKGADDDAGKYRVALARLLLRDRDAAPVTPAPAADDKKKDDKGVAIPALEERVLVMHPWTPLVVSAVIAQPLDQVEDPETLARLKEAVEEANRLIASKNEKLKGEGYLALGKALTRMGKRTDGLKAYAEGLKLIHKGISTKELQEMIDEHPAFQQPDISNIPNPVMSERYFGEGLHYYWSKQYPEAETQFRQAIRFYDKDARYQYYLGLAQLGQKTKSKRDAALHSFEKGARLEANAASTNPLVVRDINASLERVQGELRQVLNSYRYKVSSGPAENEMK